MLFRGKAVWDGDEVALAMGEVAFAKGEVPMAVVNAMGVGVIWSVVKAAGMVWSVSAAGVTEFPCVCVLGPGEEGVGKVVIMGDLEPELAALTWWSPAGYL